MLLRRVARPMLAAVFITSGINVLRYLDAHVQMAKPLLDKVVAPQAEKLPDGVPTDPETLVKIDAAVKIGAGTLLAMGKFPRLSALALAGTLVPTTVAGHPFWEIDDPQEREAQKIHFAKNLGLLGGLLIASADTAGKPSVGYRTRRATRKAEKRLAKSTESALGSVRDALPD